MESFLMELKFFAFVFVPLLCFLLLIRKRKALKEYFVEFKKDPYDVIKKSFKILLATHVFTFTFSILIAYFRYAYLWPGLGYLFFGIWLLGCFALVMRNPEYGGYLGYIRRKKRK